MRISDWSSDVCSSDLRRQTVIARFEIDYRREVAYPADLRVGVRVLAIGNSSFQIGVGIFSGETCVATARNAIVRWDRERHAAVALDDGERVALSAYLVDGDRKSTRLNSSH